MTRMGGSCHAWELHKCAYINDTRNYKVFLTFQAFLPNNFANDANEGVVSLTQQNIDTTLGELRCDNYWKICIDKCFNDLPANYESDVFHLFTFRFSIERIGIYKFLHTMVPF